MIKRELYMEFCEVRTYMIQMKEEKIDRLLRDCQSGCIIGYDGLGFQIYFSSYHLKKRIKNHHFLKEGEYHLQINPASRIRFEGAFYEYGRFIKEICTEEKIETIYGIIRMVDIKQDFFVIDIYF